jgi:hypothetical protein
MKLSAEEKKIARLVVDWNCNMHQQAREILRAEFANRKINPDTVELRCPTCKRPI